MHFIKSGAWLDELLLDDCPGMDLTVEMLGIDDRPGFMIFSPKSDCVVSGAEEAALLLEREPQTDTFDDASAQALADELLTLAPSAVITGLALGKYIGCAGSGRERFVIKKLHISRSFPGTGDLYGAVLIGSLIQGNALSAAADNAAEFVSLAIQQTPADQDTRYGVWFEPLLPRLCPVSWND